MSDGKYFTTTKKGELAELKEQLQSPKKNDKRDAVKKVIANMTVGKDVSSLFSDVINCMQTDSLELKKLVYLYLMNYAKTQPDLAIMAVNTFVKDCVDPNPLIRALAVRTMGCIRVDKITEYLCEPLRKCLQDEDPYVRKTAAICVAKLYDIDPQLVHDQGFIDALQDLLSDANPMVVANAVASLSEIHEYSRTGSVFELNAGTVSKLLTALNECTEWGQIYILDSLALYEPESDKERSNMCERVTPRLQHVNAAVVLSAVKVLMKNVGQLEDAEIQISLYKKLAPPLVTLLSAEPEVQYVALRNINLVVQKHPEILKAHMKVFFVKYNDPIYVKMEKLEIMIRLASEDNIREVLAELKEYATEVDVDFVRKSVRAIGRCAIKVDSSAQRCVDTLLDLIQTKVNYVVQEAIVVIKDIFRKYPNQYESIIATLCENLDTLDEPDAKAAMIWIVGEYAERIDNADELLDSFLENFTEETPQVQLQLLTAIVKLFLKRPSGTQELVQKVLGLSTQESDNPDLRDRGYIYWRLLLTDPAAAKAVVLCEKPLISEETDLLEPSLLDELICHISSLASVFHKPPSSFVEGRVPGRRVAPVALFEDEATLLDLGGGGAESEAPAGDSASVGDLLGDMAGLSVGTAGGNNSLSYVPAKYVWLDEAAGKGLEIKGTFARRGGQMFFDMTFRNGTSQAMGDFAIQLNKNSFGLSIASPLAVPTLAPSDTFDTSLPINNLGAVQRMDPLGKLQIAVKNSVDVFYFAVTVPFFLFLVEEGRLPKKDYLTLWREIDDDAESVAMIGNVSGDADACIAKLEANNVFLVARRSVTDQELLYMSVKFINNITALIEVTIKNGSSDVKVAVRTSLTDIVAGLHETVQSILTASASEC
ncbi:uncharacterized protein MONBRDRAFT_12202 [Monosiga brevicollis MX1]|uniref:AP complex subunit beta n=1 Tax=Monosiga brevicollis TaxID=81824 RepID=A9VBI8_MONBE|nr:uncharacterized protein MONBRDRAFT_12202 [Monosiga brevicollis MX1]EDQ85070.1 predicted protein [Monosiga brevicollis MX1]|eukprot:XP_001750074.1 hypothetical protein [Monosiga brevicollis MX1]